MRVARRHFVGGDQHGKGECLDDFEAVDVPGVPIKRPAAALEPTETRQVRDVLWLVAAVFGFTPKQLASVAKTMKCSERTIQRRIRTIKLATGGDADEAVERLLASIQPRAQRSGRHAG